MPTDPQLKVQVTEFQPQHAQQINATIAAAFSKIPEAERPIPFDDETIIHLLGDKNPAGPSIVAMAMADNKTLGCCVGIANRFVNTKGEIRVAHHIGFFFVSAEAQGRGVGRALLDSLTRHLLQIPGSFIYSFPNSRSIPVFRKLGYDSVLNVPTFVVPRTLVPMAYRKETFTVAPNDVRCRTFSFDEILRNWKSDSQGAGFIRDRNVFAWRYGPSKDRYKFMRTDDTQQPCVLVLTEHRFSKLDFTVLVDIFSKDIRAKIQPALAASRRVRSKGLFCYINSNLLQGPLPLRLSVPKKFNPRPVELVYWPNPLVSKEELAAVPYLTADWMGF